MKIQKSKINKPNLIPAIIVIALLLVSSYAFIAYKKSFWPFPPETILNTDAQQDTTNESPKNSNTIKKEESAADINSGKTSDQIPISKELVATITQLEQAGANVKFSAKVEGSSKTGTCVVSFTNPNDRPVTKQFNATTKDGVLLCGPLDIPSLEFSFLGEWNVSFRYYVESEQVTTTGKVTIQ